MTFGRSVGPMPDRIDDGDGDDFVELAIGEHEIAPTDLDIQAIRERMTGHALDLIVHLPFRQPMATSVDVFNEAFISYMDQLLTSTAPLDPAKAVVHTSCRDPEAQEELDRLEEQIRELDRVGASHDVTICYENMGNFDGPSLDQLGAMLADADARMCFDTGHAFDEAGQDGMEAFLASYADLIEHVHLQDTRPGEDLHMPLGAGEIDFEPLGEHLSGETMSICLEIFSDDAALMNDSMERAQRWF